mgnify:CR=1 FL=1|jgi:hypothetical protein
MTPVAEMKQSNEAAAAVAGQQREAPFADHLAYGAAAAAGGRGDASRRTRSPAVSRGPAFLIPEGSVKRRRSLWTVEKGRNRASRDGKRRERGKEKTNSSVSLSLFFEKEKKWFFVSLFFFHMFFLYRKRRPPPFFFIVLHHVRVRAQATEEAARKGPARKKAPRQRKKKEWLLPRCLRRAPRPRRGCSVPLPPFPRSRRQRPPPPQGRS